MAGRILNVSYLAKRLSNLSKRLLNYIEKKYLQREHKETHFPTRIVSSGFPEDKAGRRKSQHSISRRIAKASGRRLKQEVKRM
ncbi:MAG: hypothetical protein FWC36_06375 [Spirochaetes bacterium]|nr:hypothetical protein [Spirochaetota bacterium]